GLGNLIGYTTNEPYYTKDQLTMANPNLGWEKTTQYNIGLDFAMFNNRISGSLDLYKSFTEDLLMSVNIPTLTGYPNTIANIGKTNNRGVELTLNATPIETYGGFAWDTNINVAWQKDEIEELAYGDNDMVDNQWFIGRSIAVEYGYDKLENWSDTEKDRVEMATCDDNGYAFTLGNDHNKEQNGEHQMTEVDRVVLGNSSTKSVLAWNNDFTYRQVEWI